MPTDRPEHRRPTDRWVRALVFGTWFATLLAGLRVARAETTVPLPIQVELFKRVISFERGLQGRGGPQIRLLVVFRPGDGKSERAAAQLTQALGALKDLVDKPVAVVAYRFTTAAALKKALDDSQIAYLTTGLDESIRDIAAALVGVPVITVATDGDYVDLGAVVGFELVSAHPKVAVNFGQAHKQGLDFDSDLFRLARVVR